MCSRRASSRPASRCTRISIPTTSRPCLPSVSRRSWNWPAASGSTSRPPAADQQLALRRMGADFSRGTHDCGALGPPDAPLSHFRDERRKLPLPRVDESEEGEEQQVSEGCEDRQDPPPGEPPACHGGPTF